MKAFTVWVGNKEIRRKMWRQIKWAKTGFLNRMDFITRKDPVNGSGESRLCIHDEEAHPQYKILLKMELTFCTYIKIT